VVPFGCGTGAYNLDVTRPDLPVIAVRDLPPRLRPGVEPLGEYQGSGLTEATYLARTPDGQVVHVSRLLHLTLAEIDGRRTTAEIADRVSASYGRTVSPGNVGYLLDHKLAALGLLARADHDAEPVEPGRELAIFGLRLRRTLVPEAGVQVLAVTFKPLFNPVIVAAALAGLVASDAWLVRGGRLVASFQYVLDHPVLMLAVLGLTLLSTLFHECGHAAACRYGGARPGVIGMGIYVVWPAFFTNVTDAYQLGRAGRIRTDLGGVYFNALFALALTGLYPVTGYPPLLAAVVLVHLELVQQLMPSLRFDGYFILADLIGVPDLFRRIGPVLRSMIPGQPADPRVQGLKRAARITLTVWVLLMVPLIALELGLIVFNGPVLLKAFARSLNFQVHDLAGQFGHADVPAVLLSLISVALLVLPMAGLTYILLLTAQRGSRAVLAANRRHPVLWLPSGATAVLAAAVLAVHWGLLPRPAGVSVRPSAASNVTAEQQQPPAARVTARPAPRRTARRRPRAVVLIPVSAHGFDPLGIAADPDDENDAEARYAIDGSPATAWQSQYYLGDPVFGRLKAGSGLILDLGQEARLGSVTVTLGPAPGADVAIEAGGDDTLAPATLSSFTPVAAADGIGGRHTFRAARPARGRYVLIWFTRLPPVGPDRYQAEIFNIVVRGWRATKALSLAYSEPARKKQ
jgi:putative peptide zinc metalloprotease protein